MNNDLELIMKIAKMEKENEEVINHIRELEHALFMAQDYNALGLARCFEQEMINAKTALSKSALYNLQLNQVLKSKYGDDES